MSFWKYFFDSDKRQRDDIDELRQMQFRMAAAPSGGASERWVGEIADEVKELAATVRVLMRRLEAANLLDMTAIRDEVAEELRPKPRAGAKTAQAEGPGHPVSCTRCRKHGTSNDMIKVGADWLCRSCAANP